LCMTPPPFPAFSREFRKIGRRQRVDRNRGSSVRVFPESRQNIYISSEEAFTSGGSILVNEDSFISTKIDPNQFFSNPGKSNTVFVWMRDFTRRWSPSRPAILNVSE